VIVVMSKRTFHSDIVRQNEMYELPISDSPTLPTIRRLQNFKKVLLEEVDEVDEIIRSYRKGLKSKAGQSKDGLVDGSVLSDDKKLDVLTDLSDWLGDMVVYITSESVKYGLDLKKTLKIIMESNFSKLGSDGKPIKDERGKFLKGPNYWKPEPKIRELVKDQLS
jgi:predicted HAD superfamily Cof-like phosphohydrolase